MRNRIVDATCIVTLLRGFQLADLPARGFMTLKPSIRRARAAVSRYALVHAVPNERDIQMNLKQWCVLSVLVCALSGTGATSAADLRVNGQIRSAGACGIALGNGGVIDLGNLSRKDILPDSWGYLSIERNMSLTINCRQPTKVGVDLIDNRKDTRPPEQGAASFGLGNSAIGFYSIQTNESNWNLWEADGRRVWPIKRAYRGTPWDSKSWDGKHTYFGHWLSHETTSWDVNGPQTEPVAFKALTGGFTIHLNLKNDIAFTDELKIDGSMTLELAYL
ncbi:DUF1120 domain-containing protein [Burkholderia cepacia]|uniref:DUF1120 domain-containing protein n=1 Tax=Burkholderia cepacia TaxID=292 RepID=UPI002AB6BDAF|nr:DUF1120 domain-containing protein [Burkholderia cepacia]